MKINNNFGIFGVIKIFDHSHICILLHLASEKFGLLKKPIKDVTPDCYYKSLIQEIHSTHSKNSTQFQKKKKEEEVNTDL